MAKLVGRTGTVYGIDQHNPFPQNRNMASLLMDRRIRLLRAKIPPFPDEVSRDIDAIVVREFIFTYGRIPEESHTRCVANPALYDCIRYAIKTRGIFAVVLDDMEQAQENGKDAPYQRDITKNLRNFRKVYHEDELMIFRKASRQR